MICMDYNHNHAHLHRTIEAQINNYNDTSTWHMKDWVFRVPESDTRITQIKFGFYKLLPKFLNEIRISGILVRVKFSDFPTSIVSILY